MCIVHLQVVFSTLLGVSWCSVYWLCARLLNSGEILLYFSALPQVSPVPPEELSWFCLHLIGPLLHRSDYCGPLPPLFLSCEWLSSPPVISLQLCEVLSRGVVVLCLFLLSFFELLQLTVTPGLRRFSLIISSGFVPLPMNTIAGLLSVPCDGVFLWSSITRYLKKKNSPLFNQVG